MEIVVKDKSGKIIFKSSGEEFANISLDQYDVCRIKTHNGNTVFNDIKTISISRIQETHICK